MKNPSQSNNDSLEGSDETLDYYNSKNNSGGAIFITLVSNITIAVIGVATGIIAARLLGPSGEGQLSAIQTWPLLLSGFAMLGLPESLVYFISKNPHISRQVTITAMILATIFVLGFNAVAWFLLPILLSAQSAATINAARVFLLIGILYAIFGLPHGSLRGLQKFKSWNILRILPGLSWLIVLVISWTLNFASPIPLSRWFLIGTIIIGIPSLLFSMKIMQGSSRPDFKKTGALLRYGLPSVTATIPQSINLRFDQILIIALLPSRDLGLYVVAVAWSGGLAPLLSAIGSVLFPKVSSSISSEHKTSMLQRALQSSTLISFIVGVILTVATPICIPLIFGNQFSPSIPSALILVPAGAILAWVGVAEEGLRGLGKPKFVLLAEVVAAIGTVALLPILLSYFGIVGAAIASFVGYSLTAIMCIWAIGHSLNIPMHTIIVPTRTTFRMIQLEIKKFTSRFFRITRI